MTVGLARRSPPFLLAAALVGAALVLIAGEDGARPSGMPDRQEQIRNPTETARVDSVVEGGEPIVGETADQMREREVAGLPFGSSEHGEAALVQKIHDTLTQHGEKHACPIIDADLRALALSPQLEYSTWALRLLDSCYLVWLPTDATDAIRALAQKISHPRAWKLLARIYSQQVRFDLAVAALEDGVKVIPTAGMFHALGQARIRHVGQLERQGEPALSAAELRAADIDLSRAYSLEESSPSAWLLYDLAAVKFKRGDVDQAFSFLDRAVQTVNVEAASATNVFPVAALLVNAGGMYFRSGQKDVGIAYMDQGIGMVADPGRRQVLDQLKEGIISGVSE